MISSPSLVDNGSKLLLFFGCVVPTPKFSEILLLKMSTDKSLNSKLDKMMQLLVSYNEQIAAIRKEVLDLAEKCEVHAHLYVAAIDEHQQKFEQVSSEVQDVKRLFSEKRVISKNQRDSKKSENYPYPKFNSRCEFASRIRMRIRARNS